MFSSQLCFYLFGVRQIWWQGRSYYEVFTYLEVGNVRLEKIYLKYGLKL